MCCARVNPCWFYRYAIDVTQPQRIVVGQPAMRVPSDNLSIEVDKPLFMIRRTYISDHVRDSVSVCFY